MLSCVLVFGIQQLAFRQNVNRIVLTSEGFSPSTLVINKGETVVFSTQNDQPFWPASNIHPEHTLYPAFDPKRPISPEDTWSFTFPEAGRFSFHDHIFANYTGLIVVQDEDDDEALVPTLNINACAKFAEFTRKRQCWDEQLEEAMREGGVEKAFSYFNELYKTEPDVPKECHGWSHTLGKAGYAYYKEHGSIDLKPAASACGFGFYHAFLAELMKDTGDVTKAREFCVTASAKIADIETSCKHGVGHGASSMLSENPQYEGDFQGTANGAIAICEKIYTEHNDLIECYDGIFNEIYQNILNSRYGYDFNEYTAKNDPYWQCQMQKEEYKESCYVNVVGLFGSLFPDVKSAVTYALLNTHDLQNRGSKIISKIAADRIQTTIVQDTHKDSIEACDMVPPFLYDSCFSGILNGFIQHGEPGNLHVKGYAFCDEILAMDEETGTECYESFTRHLMAPYTQEQMVAACTYISNLRTVQECKQYLTDNG